VLGERLTGPLADQLARSQPDRVTLIACGLLGLLPLHAASYQRGQEIRCLLSDYAVTYAPSARVLDATRLGQAQAGTGLAAFVTSAGGLPLVDRIPRVSAGQLAASQLVWPARLLGTLTRGTHHPPSSAVPRLLARPGCPPFWP
jgi:hypothetical protein